MCFVFRPHCLHPTLQLPTPYPFIIPASQDPNSPDPNSPDPYPSEPSLQPLPHVGVSSLTIDTIEASLREQEEEEAEEQQQALIAILDRPSEHHQAENDPSAAPQSLAGADLAALLRLRGAAGAGRGVPVHPLPSPSAPPTYLARPPCVPGESSPSSDEGLQHRASIRRELAGRTRVPEVPPLATVSRSSRGDQEVGATASSESSSDAAFVPSPAGQRKKNSLRLAKKPSQAVPCPTPLVRERITAERIRRLSAVSRPCPL